MSTINLKTYKVYISGYPTVLVKAQKVIAYEDTITFWITNLDGEELVAAFPADAGFHWVEDDNEKAE